MTLGTLTSLLSQRLGMRGQLDSQIQQEVTFHQSVLERGVGLPWFLRDVQEFDVSASPWTTPAGFLREASTDCCLWVEDAEGTWHEVAKDDFGYLRAQDDLQGTGMPTAYALVGGKFHLFPTPDVEYTFKLDAFWADTVLADVADTNLWLTYAPNLILGRVGKQMALALRAAEVVQLFADTEREATRDLATENVARAQAGDPVSLRG